MSFNPNIKNHLSGFDGLTQKSGISGTHNLDAFSQAASSNGIKILGETPTSVKGIANIEYQIPAYDRAGNVIGYKAKEFTKTVYDPKIFSDQKILDLGQQAAASGYKDALSKGVTVPSKCPNCFPRLRVGWFFVDELSKPPPCSARLSVFRLTSPL